MNKLKKKHFKNNLQIEISSSKQYWSNVKTISSPTVHQTNEILQHPLKNLTTRAPQSRVKWRFQHHGARKNPAHIPAEREPGRWFPFREFIFSRGSRGARQKKASQPRQLKPLALLRNLSRKSEVIFPLFLSLSAPYAKNAHKKREFTAAGSTTSLHTEVAAACATQREREQQ